MFHYRFANPNMKKIEYGSICCTELYAKWLANHRDLRGVYCSGPINIYL